MARVRLRDLGFQLGKFPPGRWNAITDVPGVSVGHTTIIRDTPRIARTGVTVINTRPDGRRHLPCYGGLFSFNGNGEITGSHWLEESGQLAGPLAITNTHQVGLVRDTLVKVEVERSAQEAWYLPIVGETYDGFLNDINGFHITEANVRAAIDAADAPSGSGPVAEGNGGGGTGMICHGFKGGIGTSSRVVSAGGGEYTVGVLVQANYGERGLLRLDGRPIGRELHEGIVPLPEDPATGDAGSIIVVIATDAPLLADQCKRFARRATVGLSRVGGTGGNGSGDLFVAFSTGNDIDPDAVEPFVVRTLPAGQMTAMFNAVAEAVEESIWNALCAAETMTGHNGRVVHAIPLDALR